MDARKLHALQKISLGHCFPLTDAHLSGVNPVWKVQDSRCGELRTKTQRCVYIYIYIIQLTQSRKLTAPQETQFQQTGRWVGTVETLCRPSSWWTRRHMAFATSRYQTCFVTRMNSRAHVARSLRGTFAARYCDSLWIHLNAETLVFRTVGDKNEAILIHSLNKRSMFSRGASGDKWAWLKPNQRDRDKSFTCFLFAIEMYDKMINDNF